MMLLTLVVMASVVGGAILWWEFGRDCRWYISLVNLWTVVIIFWPLVIWVTLLEFYDNYTKKEKDNG